MAEIGEWRIQTTNAALDAPKLDSIRFRLAYVALEPVLWESPKIGKLLINFNEIDGKWQRAAALYREALQLSESMRIRLDRFMTAFTRPLIQEIYGEKDVAAGGMGDVVSLFRDPDVRKVRERLRRLAEMLEIDVPDVPRFLEDYGDIFLSLSYYRERLEELEPVISGFLDSLDSLRENYQLRANAGFLVSCQRIQATFNEMLAAIGGRFENFDRSTLSLWQDLTAERFRVVENLIKGYHTTIGGALCVLGVKMDAWARLFPDPMTGGPIRRSEFIMSEMKQGLEGILRIENSVPMLSALEKEGRTRAQGKTVPAGSA